MNGNRRLYRSTSEAAIGGVASGLGSYFGVDPVLFRVGFVILTILTQGAFLLVYLGLWLLLPTAGSTATETGQVIQENLNEMGARVRGLAGGGNHNPGAPNGGHAGTAANGGVANANSGTGTPPATQVNASAHPRQGAGPMILIVLGAIFLLANMGFFRAIHWGFWWPLLLITLGVIMLMRRR